MEKLLNLGLPGKNIAQATPFLEAGKLTDRGPPHISIEQKRSGRLCSEGRRHIVRRCRFAIAAHWAGEKHNTRRMVHMREHERSTDEAIRFRNRRTRRANDPARLVRSGNWLRRRPIKGTVRSIKTWNDPKKWIGRIFFKLLGDIELCISELGKKRMEFSRKG